MRLWLVGWCGIMALASGCGFLPQFSEMPSAELREHIVDFRHSLSFAKRANQVYDEERTSGPGVMVGEIPRSEVRYLLEQGSDGHQHIAVRGTSNVRNLLLDSKLAPKRDAKLGIVLHRGFAEAGTELYGQLLPLLDREKPVTLTGHSLGGALATILGMWLDVDGYQVVEIVTFGQPKVTNDEGVERFSHLPVLRFTNDDDPVSDLPPGIASKSGHWRYAHLGPEVILRGDRGYVFLEPHQVAVRSLRSFYDQLGDHEIEDHEIEAYIKHLRVRQDGATEVPAR